MTEETILTLNQINKQFYHSQAQTWEKSRRYFWPSWYKFWSASSLGDKLMGSLLDVGCGTGRFFNFWQQQQPQGKWQYLGIDNSASLLNLARQSPKKSKGNVASWQQVDLVESLIRQQLIANSSFNLITLFGVLHHIPSVQLRARLIDELYDLLLPGGELWLTTWQPQRTGQRVPSLADPRQMAERFKFNYEELEPGDVFIGWHDSPAVRYVHWWQPQEDVALDDHEIQIVKDWSEISQGERGNLCWLIQKAG